MEDFIPNRGYLLFRYTINGLEVGWVLCNQEPPFENVDNIRQGLFLGEIFDIAKQSGSRNPGERVLDSVDVRSWEVWS